MYFPFFLWTLKVFYFGILKLWSFQFFFLPSFFSCEGSQEGRWGVCLSFYELWRFFVLVFWSFGVFNFLLIIFGSSIFCVKFQRGEGCKQDNISPTHLLNGLFLGEYSHKSPQKNILKSWNFSLYYYVKVYVTDFKKYFIFKSFELHLHLLFLCLKATIIMFNEWFWKLYIHWIFFKLIHMFQWCIRNLTILKKC